MGQNMSYDKWKKIFGDDNGYLPDIYLKTITVDTLNNLAGLILAQGWKYDLIVNGKPAEYYLSDVEFDARVKDALHLLQIHLDRQIQLNLYVMSRMDMFFDVDRREISDEESFEVLLQALRVIGNGVGSKILFHHEGGDAPVLSL